MNNKQLPDIAFIAERKNLLYHKLISGEKFFYIPPESFDSSLFLDMLSIPVKQNFPYIKEFDSMYVYNRFRILCFFFNSQNCFFN